MSQFGKLIMVLGALAVIVGALIWGLGKLGFKGLPGDIHYESDRVRVYIPIVTCLVISIVLTAVFSLGRWLGR